MKAFSACPHFSGKPLKYLRVEEVQAVGGKAIRSVFFQDHLFKEPCELDCSTVGVETTQEAVACPSNKG